MKEPWIVSENEQLRLLLEGQGLPQLVPELVLPDLYKLTTWEDAVRASREQARRIERNLAEHPCWEPLKRFAEAKGQPKVI